MTQKQKWFGTDGIRGFVGESPMTVEFILHLGWAFGSVLKNLSTEFDHNPLVLIGKDTRISGYMFEAALEAGLSAAGVDVYLLGPLPTPAIAYLTHSMRADAGIAISASHNSYVDNGIKFFNNLGFKLSEKLELVIEKKLEIPMQTVLPHEIGKVKRLYDSQGRYIEFCKHSVVKELNLQGLHIVIDTANGAAYKVAPQVLKDLGAQVTVIHNEPDGFNINVDCGATNPTSLSNKVCELGADLGLALDGDADRLIMADKNGNILDGDDLLYIIASNYQQTNKLSGVVGTLMSNLGLEQALTQRNLKFVRTPVGDKYIAERLVELGWTLGGESSGHIVNLECSTTGDGILTALQVLSILKASKIKLEQFAQEWRKYTQIIVNVPVASHDVAQTILSSAQVQQEIKIIEQLMIKNNGRLLVRPSGTENVIRIMVEADLDKNKLTQIAEELAGKLNR